VSVIDGWMDVRVIRKGGIRCKSGSYISKHVVYGVIGKSVVMVIFQG